MLILSIVLLIAAIIVHEVAHAWAADKLGDPTARLMGRLTLNPIPHLDPYGSILIPFLLVFIGSPILFGWAKPVPFDPYNLKNPRKDSALIALAGPASNIIMAAMASLTLYFVAAFIPPIAILIGSLIVFIQVNLVLAFFNLIPIHPLDGGKILVALLPEEVASEIDTFLRRYGVIVLLLLIFPIVGDRSAVSYVLGPIIEYLMDILVPSALFYN